MKIDRPCHQHQSWCGDQTDQTNGLPGAADWEWGMIHSYLVAHPTNRFCGWNNPGYFNGISVGARRPLKKLGLELTHLNDSWDEPPSMNDYIPMHSHQQTLKRSSRIIHARLNHRHQGWTPPKKPEVVLTQKTTGFWTVRNWESWTTVPWKSWRFARTWHVIKGLRFSINSGSSPVKKWWNWW